MLPDISGLINEQTSILLMIIALLILLLIGKWLLKIIFSPIIWILTKFKRKYVILFLFILLLISISFNLYLASKLGMIDYESILGII